MRLTNLSAFTGSVLAGLFIACPTALAAPTISISVGAEPTESIATQIAVSGSTEVESRYVVTEKASGGSGCGANQRADSGEVLGGDQGELSSGTFTASQNFTFRAAGSYLLCGWIVQDHESGETVLASTSLTVSVRQPHIELSIAGPGTVAPGTVFQLSTTAQAETSREVIETIVPSTGRGCPANASVAESTSDSILITWPGEGSPWNVDGGPFTEVANVKLEHVGSYLVCAYAEYPSKESPPEATASAAISVVKPPRPCRVPAVSPGTSLSVTEHKITAADCTVGAIHHRTSRAVPSGRVISLSPASGTKLAAHADVSATVSSGPPPRRHRRRRRHR